ncbi:hypothetical protein BDQ12DRAFT_652301 [Crucibulum laeve]|uniref:Uncharacterized protein n=1 Tax=Crucibulum laeve TaxID=68775 RepID=A0A5C3MA69_9AGAR|nr:hypothetical protein BDQ12DRAFT_652301 [Crucibulum laeve]
MISKIWMSATFVLALSAQVYGHAAIAPALGVAGTPVRNDVERPSTANPCGSGVNIASTIDSSTAVAAAADGSFTTTVTNFNGGADGSRKVTAQVDATGAGTKFVAATVTTNGDAAPAAVGSQKIVASLPAGTKCTGGATGNKCLVSFKTTAGFGNCVVVSQGAAAAAGNAGAATGAAAGAATGAAAGAAAGAATGAAAGAATGAAAGTAAGATTATGKGRGRGRNGKKAAAAAAAGTRAARALLAEIESRGEEAVHAAKRSLTSWLWA